MEVRARKARASSRPLRPLPYSATMSAPILSKQEITLLATGFVLGFVLIGALTALGLSIGCSPSIWFGIPHQ